MHQQKLVHSLGRVSGIRTRTPYGIRLTNEHVYHSIITVANIRLKYYICEKSYETI